MEITLLGKNNFLPFPVDSAEALFSQKPHLNNLKWVEQKLFMRHEHLLEE